MISAVSKTEPFLFVCLFFYKRRQFREEDVCHKMILYLERSVWYSSVVICEHIVDCNDIHFAISI